MPLPVSGCIRPIRVLAWPGCLNAQGEEWTGVNGPQTKNHVRWHFQLWELSGGAHCTWGTQFQTPASLGPYEVTLATNVLRPQCRSDGGQMRGTRNPRCPLAPCSGSSRPWGGLPTAELRGILRMCAYGSSGCWEGMTQPGS